ACCRRRDPGDRMDADRSFAVSRGRRHHRAKRVGGRCRCRPYPARRCAGRARHPRHRPLPHCQCQRGRGNPSCACLVDHAIPTHGDAACLHRREAELRQGRAQYQGAAQGALRTRSRHDRDRARRLRRRRGSAGQGGSGLMEVRNGESAAARGELINVEDLSVNFRGGGKVTHAVKHVSFDISRAETVALVGESGSGKTVTALSILKLLPYPSASHPSGKIWFKGENLMTLRDSGLRTIRGNKISMIFQEPMTSLNPLHTIEQQVGEVLKIHRGLSDRAARARVLDLLDKVGIDDPEGRLASYPHQLSGGQRQRVMIAMALANEPDLLIADEPTTALDVTIQAQILDLLAKLKDEFQMAMLLITHDL